MGKNKELEKKLPFIKDCAFKLCIDKKQTSPLNRRNSSWEDFSGLYTPFV